MIKQTEQTPIKPNETVVSLTQQALEGIEKTLQYLEERMICADTIRRTKKALQKIASETDIFDYHKVLIYVNNLKREEKVAQYWDIDPQTPLSKGYKLKIIYQYVSFCKANGIDFKPPKIDYASPIPLIPIKENLIRIFTCASDSYATIFTIMSETAIEPDELHKVPLNQIDKLRGIISVVGNKRHANGTYVLKSETATMLRQYLDKPMRKNYFGKEYVKHQLPFPTSKAMRQAWEVARDKAYNKYKIEALKDIKLKSLSNYAGAVFYFANGKCTLETQEFMRHKNLQQTANYLRDIKGFKLHTEKIGRIVTNADDALELILQGFKEEAVFNQGTPQEKHVLSKIII